MTTPLEALRAAMGAHGIDAVYIPTADYHGSEYLGDYFACLPYLSGFTGSAGSLVVRPDWAGLWTDGRYFIQAQEQLEGSGITLMKQGQPNVPSPEAYLAEALADGQRLAFDGRCVSAEQAARFQTQLSPKGIAIFTELDLVGEVWPSRPPRSAAPVWALALAYAGVPRREKLAAVRGTLATRKADACLFTALEDIAWLLNLRGGDMACTPVFLSYLAVENSRALLFANLDSFSPDLMDTLRQDGVHLRPYDGFYDYAAALPAQSRLCVDRKRANSRLLDCIRHCAVLDGPSPVTALKAVKNPVEVRNAKDAHRKDGVALTRFMYWLKTQAASGQLTERSASDRLEALRQEQAHYLGPSFSPIVAYGPHGAIVHYTATGESNADIAPAGFLLVDTGGHYLEGTTDCTRTFAMGPLTETQKTHYTAVLRGNLALANAQFLRGCTGVNLDYLARAPLWAMNLDFNHGTGHGVGALLSVHEGPQAIRTRSTASDAPLEAGMITSNEPGLYLEGQYGIRLENLLLCVPRGSSSFGSFLGFEPLSLVPFDLDAVAPTQMTELERRLLDAYHRQVYAQIAPHLSETEAAWLALATAAVSSS